MLQYINNSALNNFPLYLHASTIHNIMHVFLHIHVTNRMQTVILLHTCWVIPLAN